MLRVNAILHNLNHTCHLSSFEGSRWRQNGRKTGKYFKKWVTIFQYHVSFVPSHQYTVDLIALSTGILLNHIKGACNVFFSAHSALLGRRKLVQKMKIGPDKKNRFFFTFFQFFKEISQNTELSVHRFIRLTNYIKMSIGFKFHHIPIKNMVKTEFRIFLQEEILTAEKKIFSIENFN